MAITATGVVGKKVSKLKTMLSESSTLQARIPSGSAAKALGYIHHPTYFVDNDDEYRFPFVVIERGPGFGYSEIGGGAGNLLRPYGSLRIKIAERDRFPSDIDSSLTDFSNFAEGVISDLAGVAGADDNLTIVGVEQEDEPFFHELGSRQRYWWQPFVIRWANRV